MSEEGIKFDKGKPQADLLLDFGNALKSVAEVATFGANKYGRGNWQYVEGAEQRYTAALMRHILDLKQGEDDETHLPQLAHIAWNALAVLELRLRG